VRNIPFDTMKVFDVVYMKDRIDGKSMFDLIHREWYGCELNNNSYVRWTIGEEGEVDELGNLVDPRYNEFEDVLRKYGCIDGESVILLISW